jgi:phosphinothricin acetyltransferase
MDIESLAAAVLGGAIATFRANKGWADKAIVQIDDDKLRTAVDPNTNSIAVIMKHVAGNLLSRWTDFLMSDGEKSWRNRDDEFIDSFANREELLTYWESGWNRLFETLESLRPDDLSKTVTIRGEPHSVPLAIQRSLAHCGYHVGQIIMIARILAGDSWRTITIPRGGSRSYNQQVWGRANYQSTPPGRGEQRAAALAPSPPDDQYTPGASAAQPLIRRAQLADLAAITEIYNEAILTTTATFDTEPKTPEQRLEWFRGHDERHPIIVAVLEGQVVGWASISTWSERRAYDDTAETSFYVKSEFRGRGIGRRLKDAAIEDARRQGFHTLIARVAEGSDASLHLNESCGFVRVGTLREVGRKFGRLLDVHILQKMLD